MCLSVLFFCLVNFNSVCHDNFRSRFCGMEGKRLCFFTFSQCSFQVVRGYIIGFIYIKGFMKKTGTRLVQEQQGEKDIHHLQDLCLLHLCLLERFSNESVTFSTSIWWNIVQYCQNMAEKATSRSSMLHYRDHTEEAVGEEVQKGGSGP